MKILDNNTYNQVCVLKLLLKNTSNIKKKIIKSLANRNRTETEPISMWKTKYLIANFTVTCIYMSLYLHSYDEQNYSDYHRQKILSLKWNHQ